MPGGSPGRTVAGGEERERDRETSARTSDEVMGTFEGPGLTFDP